MVPECEGTPGNEGVRTVRTGTKQEEWRFVAVLKKRERKVGRGGEGRGDANCFQRKQGCLVLLVCGVCGVCLRPVSCG